MASCALQNNSRIYIRGQQACRRSGQRARHVARGRERPRKFVLTRFRGFGFRGLGLSIRKVVIVVGRFEVAVPAVWWTNLDASQPGSQSETNPNPPTLSPNPLRIGRKQKFMTQMGSQLEGRPEGRPDLLINARWLHLLDSPGDETGVFISACSCDAPPPEYGVEMDDEEVEGLRPLNPEPQTLNLNHPAGAAEPASSSTEKKEEKKEESESDEK